MPNAVSEYLDYATVHGLGRLKNTPYAVLKVVWVLSLCASLGMIIFQFYLLLTKFQSHPISTSIELKTPRKIAFPAVTICNTNPVNYHDFDLDTELQGVVDQAGEKYQININMFNESDEYASASVSKDPIRSDILWYTAERFRMYFNELSNNELENISQKVNQFMILCNYNGEDCQQDAIETVRTYEYGVCYNIYPEKLQGRSSRLVSAAGKRYGFELLLFTDEVQAVPFVTHSSSVYIMVHDKKPGTTHMFMSGGVVVPSGFEADIEVSLVEETRVPGVGAEPRCHPTATSYTECIHNCQQQDIASNCNCRQVPFVLQFEETDNFLGGYFPCKSEDEYQCIQDVLGTYINQMQDVCSKCKTPCYELSYKTKVGMTTWPSDNFVPILRRILSASDSVADFTAIDGDFVRINLGMVRVYLSSLSYESVTEEYSYSPVNFVSDIGGTLGLWAGFSALSLLEIFELLVILCALRRGRQKTGVEGARADEETADNL